MQQGCLELGHPQVRAAVAVGEIVAGVAASAAVVVEAIAGFEQRVVAGEDRAAFAGVEVLAGLEAEAAGDAVRPHLAPAPLGQVRLARVLDQRDAALLRDRQDRVEIGGGPAEVHRDDGPRASA